MIETLYLDEEDFAKLADAKSCICQYCRETRCEKCTVQAIFDDAANRVMTGKEKNQEMAEVSKWQLRR